MMGLTRSSKPATIRLSHVCLRIGEMVAIFYKEKYLRPRPNIICPALQPPLGPPGHPAFPSGHALQGWLLTKWLVAITTKDGSSVYQKQLEWLATRVAENRERAGIHYPSDTIGGRHLAQVVYEQMSQMIGITATDAAAGKFEARVLRKIVEDAQKEWA
jgi:membrane-associated phospholipid phosphatase